MYGYYLESDYAVENKAETNSQRQMKSNSSILLYMIIMITTCILPQPWGLMAQEKHALLVGISEYPQYTDNDASWTKIHGVNDVQLIKPILKKQGFRINTLQDKTATYKAITKSLAKLKNEVREGDIVYLHFSGHGQAVEDESGDEVDGWDEAFIPYDAQKRYKVNVYSGERHLLDDELNEYLNAIRKRIGQKGILYVVIDACHAGSSFRGDDVEDSVFVRGADIGFSKNGKVYAPHIDKRGSIRVQSIAGMAPKKSGETEDFKGTRVVRKKQVLLTLSTCNAVKVPNARGNLKSPITAYRRLQILDNG